MLDLLKGCRDDRRGFTLVELIVIILIVGIVSGGVVLSLATVSKENANSCAEQLSKILEQTRLETMSRVDGEVELELCVKDDSYYGLLKVAGAVKSEVKLGSASLSLTMISKDGGVQTVSSGHPFCIRFDKGSGAFRFDSGHPEFSSIRVAGSNERVIKVYQPTGRNLLE